MADRRTTRDNAIAAYRSGAGVGIYARNFPGLDIDVDDEALAEDLEGFAIATLGPAPVRMREGSARRLLMYAGSGLRKVALPLEGGGAVELLATGQYYNVEGTHPSGKPYYWRGAHPTSLGPFGLTEIDEDKIKACFQTS